VTVRLVLASVSLLLRQFASKVHNQPRRTQYLTQCRIGRTNVS